MTDHSLRKEFRGLRADVRAKLPTATPESPLTARMQFDLRKAEKAALTLRKKNRTGPGTRTKQSRREMDLIEGRDVDLLRELYVEFPHPGCHPDGRAARTFENTGRGVRMARQYSWQNEAHNHTRAPAGYNAITMEYLTPTVSGAEGELDCIDQSATELLVDVMHSYPNTATWVPPQILAQLPCCEMGARAHTLRHSPAAIEKLKRWLEHQELRKAKSYHKAMRVIQGLGFHLGARPAAQPPQSAPTARASSAAELIRANSFSHGDRQLCSRVNYTRAASAPL